MSDMYILDDSGTPVVEPDVIAWSRWRRANLAATVRQTPIDDAVGSFRVVVSTVFLGIDHNFCLGGPPILWETMIFGIVFGNQVFEDYQERYSSLADAIAGHTRAVDMVLSRTGDLR
jgi:hypothetical protein